MNLLHLKYAVEVEKTRSISKAAENLYMNQPNLSRAIKELEETTGFSIFKRTSKGMIPTEQGEDFIANAKKLLAQIDSFEARYDGTATPQQTFSISVPRVSYIASAFTNFVNSLDKTVPTQIYYKETNSARTLINVLQDDYNLGIVRYRSVFKEHFNDFFNSKSLSYELISEFQPNIVFSENNPLAKKDILEFSDLKDMIEISDGDVFAPSIPMADVKKTEYFENVNKKIFVYERCSRFELLVSVPDTFMHTSHIPPEILKRYSLVEKKCIGYDCSYNDVLIYNKGYRFSELDNRFISFLTDENRRFN